MSTCDLVEHRHIRVAPPSRGGYVEGCRCDQCRAADATYQRTRIHRRYAIGWRPSRAEYVVTNGGRVVHHAPTLSACEQWILDGGADQWEAAQRKDAA